MNEVEYVDPVASVRGEQWIMTLVCPWRLRRNGNIVVEPDVLEGDFASNQELVANALEELLGQDLTEVRNSTNNFNDPVFYFNGGYVLEVESDTDIDPWTFSLPGITFVGTMTVM